MISNGVCARRGSLSLKCYVFPLLFLLTVFTSSCSPPADIGAEKGADQLPPPQWEAADSIPPQSQELKVHVYVDATTSMKGYVSASNSTQYMTTLQNIESAITSGWPKTRITYYKFGSWIQPLSGRDHIRSLAPDFYLNSGISAETEMDKVLSQPSISAGGNLSVIVTDLFQKDSDVSLLTNLLKENCLQKGVAVGVAGIRSQFHGTIYDAGVNGESYAYGSKEGATGTYRPFYILVLGNHADVSLFLDRLCNKLPFVSKSNCSIISRHLVQTPVTFEGSSRTKAANLNPIEDLAAGPSSNSTKIRQLRLLKDTDAHATYSVPISTAAYAPLFLQKPPVFQVTGEEFKKGKKLGVSDGLLVDNVDISGEKMNFSVKVKPGALQAGHAYRFRIVGRPANESSATPQWWSEWNLQMGDVVSHQVRRDAKIDGSRTQNLFVFLTSLWEANLTTAPKLFDSYLYIIKKQ